MGSGGKNECTGCITRVPYATLIALIMCWAGVGVFCGTMYRGVNLSLRLLQDVFKLDKGLQWIEPTQLTFVILGASMAALALMILVTAFLATGATRREVYRSSTGRVGGRVASACFIFICYILLLAWLVVLVCCVIMTTFTTLGWGVCSTDDIGWNEGTIDFYPFHFMFPEGTQKVNMLVEGQSEIKLFCKDFIQRAEVHFILATLSCSLVVLSLVHFLMSLAANYAHIRGHDKFTDLQELQTLDMMSETMTLTDRGDITYMKH